MALNELLAFLFDPQWWLASVYDECSPFYMYGIASSAYFKYERMGWQFEPFPDVVMEIIWLS